MPLASASLTYPAKALNWHFITASYLFKIYVSLEIDGSSGSFRATCAYSSLNVRRNWNFRPSVIVSCLFARTAGGCVDLVLDQAARRLRQTPRGFRFASQRTCARRLSCPTPNDEMGLIAEAARAIAIGPHCPAYRSLGRFQPLGF